MFARKLIKKLISSNSSLISPSFRSIRFNSELASDDQFEAKKMIAVVQLNSSADKEKNHRVNVRLVREAASYGSSMIFLPENFDGKHFTKEGVANAREPIDGPMISSFRDLARSLNVWISLGGFHEKPTDRDGDDDGKRYTTHVLIKNDGEIAAIYRKLHLFDVPDVPHGGRVVESIVVVPGDEVVPPIETPIGKLGLCVCYDIRFPELSTILAKAGADVLTYPSGYSMINGSSIWEVCARSRALENQCYVVGACQVGYHNPRYTAWGRSMVIDPRGTIIAQVGEEVGLAIAVIDPEVQRLARIALPDVNIRRTDVYGDLIAHKMKRN